MEVDMYEEQAVPANPRNTGPLKSSLMLHIVSVKSLLICVLPNLLQTFLHVMIAFSSPTVISLLNECKGDQTVAK